MRNFNYTTLISTTTTIPSDLLEKIRLLPDFEVNNQYYNQAKHAIFLIQSANTYVLSYTLKDYDLNSMIYKWKIGLQKAWHFSEGNEDAQEPPEIFKAIVLDLKNHNQTLKDVKFKVLKIYKERLDEAALDLSFVHYVREYEAIYFGLNNLTMHKIANKIISFYIKNKKQKNQKLADYLKKYDECLKISAWELKRYMKWVIQTNQLDNKARVLDIQESFGFYWKIMVLIRRMKVDSEMVSLFNSEFA
ncbi:hypothetical protein ACJA23_02245 [Mycoplasma corogypsi]|uniref:hypothetical protein n=1 Tax=Mycoplasma corogypsi TaxID=2106 RepID=UPI0038739054